MKKYINNPIVKFIIVFVLSFIAVEVIEYAIESFLGFDIHNIEAVWLGSILLWMFKTHILCCIIPAVWTAYRCTHKKRGKCEHDYCK